MKEPLLICDLFFNDGSGPLRASGSDARSLLESVGKLEARQNGVLISDVIWIRTKDGYVNTRASQPKERKPTAYKEAKHEKELEKRDRWLAKDIR